MKANAKKNKCLLECNIQWFNIKDYISKVSAQKKLKNLIPSWLFDKLNFVSHKRLRVLMKSAENEIIKKLKIESNKQIIT